MIEPSSKENAIANLLQVFSTLNEKERTTTNRTIFGILVSINIIVVLLISFFYFQPLCYSNTVSQVSSLNQYDTIKNLQSVILQLKDSITFIDQQLKTSVAQKPDTIRIKSTSTRHDTTQIINTITIHDTSYALTFFGKLKSSPYKPYYDVVRFDTIKKTDKYVITKSTLRKMITENIRRLFVKKDTIVLSNQDADELIRIISNYGKEIN